MKVSNRIISFLTCIAIMLSCVAVPNVAHAGLQDAWDYSIDTITAWISGSSSKPLGGWPPAGALDSLFSSSQPQKYYTTPTSSVQSKYGNVTNYNRSGDTTNTKIIDSYNRTFNTIHNTNNTSTTNNYN